MTVVMIGTRRHAAPNGKLCASLLIDTGLADFAVMQCCADVRAHR